MNVATGPKGPVTSSEESDEDKLMADQAQGGGFTNVDPSVRRIVPDAKGRTVVKVVYVVLESQYQSALSSAVNSLNANNDKVCFEVSGYLLEELRKTSIDKVLTKYRDCTESNALCCKSDCETQKKCLYGPCKR